MALAEPRFRNELYRQLQRSPNREHKLLLSDFLAVVSGGFRERFAAGYSADAAGLHNALRSLPPLEIYFPVDEHRASWTPSPKVLVATALSDGAAISAFDINGDPVQVSSSSPPDDPVIAVVIAEGVMPNRSTAEGSHVDSDVLGFTSDFTIDMVEAEIYNSDNYEGWLAGDPEFEVQVEYAAPNDTAFAFGSCAGQYAQGSYNYDHNNDSWTGNVRLAELDETSGASYRMRIWERDTGDCAWPTSEGDPIGAGVDLWEEIVRGIAVVAVATDGCEITGPAAVLCSGVVLGSYAGYLFLSNPEDDYVGEMTKTGNRDDCWTDITNPISFNLIDENGAPA